MRARAGGLQHFRGALSYWLARSPEQKVLDGSGKVLVRVKTGSGEAYKPMAE